MDKKKEHSKITGNGRSMKRKKVVLHPDVKKR